jgi:hypothetical protein
MSPQLSGVRLQMLQTLLLRGVLEWGREMDGNSDSAPVATISQDTESEAPSNEVQHLPFCKCSAYLQGRRCGSPWAASLTGRNCFSTATL